MQHSCWRLDSYSVLGKVSFVDARASLWRRVRGNGHHGLQQQPVARKARSSLAGVRAYANDANQAGLGGPWSSSQAVSPAQAAADLEVVETAGDAAPVIPRRRRNPAAPAQPIWLPETTTQPYKRADYAPGTRVGEKVQVLLARQLRDLMKNPIPGVSVAPDENDTMTWHAVLIGPEGSPYADGLFQVDLDFTSNFPGEQPNITFCTPIWHPNIDSTTGRTCVKMGINRNAHHYYDYYNPSGPTVIPEWYRGGHSKVRSVACVLVGLQMLLSTPNFEDPANPMAGYGMLMQRDAFYKKAMEWTRIYAIEKQASCSNAVGAESFS